MAEPWAGKHMWIWMLDRCGAPQDVVSRAVSLGLAGLIVKGWDGSRYWPDIEKIIGPAHDAGLVIGAWGYSYGDNPDAEAYAAKKCLDAGADWLIVDAEAEYEQRPNRARAALGAYRTLGAPLGYTSYGLPRYHAAFPWADFSAACDAALPQVYWGDFGLAVDEALALSLADYGPLGPPVAPVGQCYGGATPDDITRFGDLAEAAGLPGISYWSWQHASPEQFAAVGRAPYGKEAEPAVSDWAKAAWDKATAKGVLDGTDPRGAVEREMLAVVLDRCGLLDAADVPRQAVDDLKAAGIIVDNHPVGGRVTWGELAIVIARLLSKIKGV